MHNIMHSGSWDNDPLFKSRKASQFYGFRFTGSCTRKFSFLILKGLRWVIYYARSLRRAQPVYAKGNELVVSRSTRNDAFNFFQFNEIGDDENEQSNQKTPVVVKK